MSRRNALRDVTSILGGLSFGAVVCGGFALFGAPWWEAGFFGVLLGLGFAAALQLVLFPTFGDEGEIQDEATPEWFAELGTDVREARDTTAFYRGVHR